MECELSADMWLLLELKAVSVAGQAARSATFTGKRAGRGRAVKGAG